MSTSSFRAAFRTWFGLTDAETEVLGVLYDAKGELRTAPTMAIEAGIKLGSLMMLISRLRQVMDEEAIDCVPGRGYRLTEVGIGECRSALWTIGEELRRAS